MTAYESDQPPLADADEMLPPEPPGGRTNNVRTWPHADMEAMIEANGADSQRLAERAQELADQIVDWWNLASASDAAAAAAKSTEYGGAGAAIDLVWLGEQLADMRGGVNGTNWLTGRERSAQEATELGIFFYVLGKVARWKAAILEGRPVSDDTIKDLHTYTMMARYNREHGSWP